MVLEKFETFFKTFLCRRQIYCVSQPDRMARFSTMAEQMLTGTSLFVDLSKLTISSKPLRRERTTSAASCRPRKSE